MIALSTETIAAIATPPGHGAVGIIRVSGTCARVIVTKHFASSRRTFRELRPYRLHHGHFFNGTGQILDEVLVAFMPGPGSFTGEDVVEINCHGSPVVLQSILETLLQEGVHPANPGEFTQRAFLNGRMDLTQAEAVAEIISAVSPTASLLAQNKLSGALRHCLQGLRDRLEELRAQLCLAVDFPEEEVECLSPELFLQSVEDIRKQLGILLQGHLQSRIWNDGALCVLSGAVNAGKSSLLNQLLGRQRAIVSPEPGTTRDYLEERITLHGLSLRLVDVAGTRKEAGILEREGLALARQFQDEADLILLVVDIATQAPLGVVKDQNLSLYPPSRTLIVANKCDLKRDPETESFLSNQGYDVVPVSAKNGQGLEELQDRIWRRLIANSPEPRPDALTLNLRQSGALEQAALELERLREDIMQNVPYDLLGVRLESASVILAEITGEITSDEILESIFQRFCIGK
ncbi:tRNA modification GTPase [Desulfonatronum thiosulfatophilum]|uniref:tRNA modification GTPase MnmE n=1 Tax=Desulfonatronum thiosulfatophilum TaxID=617002 RepID=A0A1G6CWT8_9BACT|nr:tRNA uridine-5-carboxymethylaminomethyl(34) synthesis GTPase MnmE [Desulfonatronum thiosulfatophilum]SDB37387.1 tRNA modification GTPase [Desulfonatronum thiosulfatophilum]